MCGSLFNLHLLVLEARERLLEVLPKLLRLVLRLVLHLPMFEMHGSRRVVVPQPVVRLFFGGVRDDLCVVREEKGAAHERSGKRVRRSYAFLGTRPTDKRWAGLGAYHRGAE